MTLTDSGRPAGEGPSGDPRDASTAPVGTVAEEAARLVEMLAGPGGPWSGTGAGGGRPADGPHDTPDAADGSSHTPSADGESADRGPGHACTCGGTTPQACRLCPVCQVISFVGSISPETIERAADLVGFAATALRDLATVQRSRQAGAETPASAEDETP